jgi:predicted secreted Zn-dependent protease
MVARPAVTEVMRFAAWLLLCAAATGSHAQTYRCERDGRIAFSDRPCEAGAKSTRKDYSAAGASGVLDLDVAVKHYTVQGRDYPSLLASLNANGPRGYHGIAGWKVGYQYTTKQRRDACQIDSVRVKITGEILMPRWADEQSAPQALQRRWSDYYAALKLHEDGHIQHGRELALLMKEKLMGLGAVPCDRTKGLAQAEFQRLYGNLSARDQEYDARTNHGATQGARF